MPPRGQIPEAPKDRDEWYLFLKDHQWIRPCGPVTNKKPGNLNGPVTAHKINEDSLGPKRSV